MKLQSIKSPEGVALLMENLWLRHRAGLKQRENNVYMVELPPITEDVDSTAKLFTDDFSKEEYKSFFGGWIK